MKICEVHSVSVAGKIRPDAYMERKKIDVCFKLLLKQFHYFPTSITIILTIHESQPNTSDLIDDANAVIYT